VIPQKIVGEFHGISPVPRVNDDEMMIKSSGNGRNFQGNPSQKKHVPKGHRKSPSALSPSRSAQSVLPTPAPAAQPKPWVEEKIDRKIMGKMLENPANDGTNDGTVWNMMENVF
jgi:hypothetical protein